MGLKWDQGIPERPGIYFFSPTKQDVDIPMLVGISTTIDSTGLTTLTIRHIQAYDFDPFYFPGISNVNVKSITRTIDKTGKAYYHINDKEDRVYFIGEHPLAKCWFAGPIERPPRTVE